MQAIVNAPNRFRRYMAGLGLAALAVTLLAAAVAGGPAQAQNPTNTYDDPQPCGPGPESLAPAFMEEPHEVTSGHYALFDAYWEHFDVGDDPDNDGVPHLNTCPPPVGTKTVTRYNHETRQDEEVTVPVLVAPQPPHKALDIDEAIFHVLDDREAIAVQGTAVDTDDEQQISLTEYAELGLYAASGDTIWWLRLDDPDTSTNEASDLRIGFSTMRFSDLYWQVPDDIEDDGSAFEYHFELERHAGIPASAHPHFLAYRAPKANDGPAKLIWDSALADTQPLKMNPGEITDLQWIFTQPGTYTISVHLRGAVRQAAPSGAGDDWEPISGSVVETSEVKRYVFQVGAALDETEPPSFGVSYTIDAAPSAGDSVGAPIRVLGAEKPTLTYTLAGDGHEHFAVVALSNPDRAQIVVADGVTLNPVEQKGYDLTIGVTDGVDHEGNDDDSIDHTLAVNIELTYPWMTLTVDDPHPHLYKTVTLTAHVVNFGTPGNVTIHFIDEHGHNLLSLGSSFPIARGQASTERFFAYATYLPEDGDADTDTQRLDATSWVTITWR